MKRQGWSEQCKFSDASFTCHFRRKILITFISGYFYLIVSSLDILGTDTVDQKRNSKLDDSSPKMSKAVFLRKDLVDLVPPFLLQPGRHRKENPS